LWIAADTATGTVPELGAGEHGACAPPGSAGAIVKWQSMICEPFGSMTPLSVAVVPVIPLVSMAENRS